MVLFDYKPYQKMCKCNNDCHIIYIHKNLCIFVEKFYNINYEVELVYAACNKYQKKRQALIPFGFGPLSILSAESC